MSEMLWDILKCSKLAVFCFMGIALLGAIVGSIIGLTNGGIRVETLFNWIFYIGVWVSSFGLALCGISFAKMKHMEDLNHQKDWRKYFYRLNLIGVIFTMSMVEFGILMLMDYILIAMKIK